MADFSLGRGVIDIDPTSAVLGLGKISAAAAAAGAAISVLPGLLASAAGVGGVIKASFSGVGDAMKAYAADQDNATKAAKTSARQAAANARQIRDAQKSIDDARKAQARTARDTARQITDAEKNVRDAAEDAAERIADAKARQADVAERGAERIEDAEERVQDAQQDALRAQEDLTRAREEAERQLQDLREATEDFALDEEGAAARVGRARERLRIVNVDHQASVEERAEAEYNLKRALDDQADMLRDHKRANEDLAKAEKAGVEGSERVLDAKERVADAEERVVDAQDEQKKAVRDAAKANQDAAKDVADAIEEGAERQAEAMEALARTRESAAEANADAADRVADAELNLADVHAQQAEQAQVAADATNTYQDALNKLLPSQRALVEQLIAMQPLFDQLKASAADAFLPGLVQMLKDSEGLFPIFNDFLRETGTIMGDTARQMGTLFKSEDFKSDLKATLDASLPITEAIGDSLVDMTRAFFDFGAASAPAAKGFASAIGSITSGLEGFFAQLKPHMEAFGTIWEGLGDIVEAVLPIVGQIIGLLAERFAAFIPYVAEAVGLVADALMPALEALEPVFQVLGELAGQLVLAFGSFIADVLRAIAPLLPPLADAFVQLVQAIMPLIPVISQFAGQVLNAVLPILPVLTQVIIDLIQDAVIPLIPPLLEIIQQLMPGMIWIIQQVVPIIVWLAGILKDVLVWTIQTIVIPILHLVADTITWLNTFWDAFGQKIADTWTWITDTVSAGWYWLRDNIFEPLRVWITETVPNAFSYGADMIGFLWDKVKQAVRAPIQAVVDFVYNDGIVAMWNGFADFIGLSGSKLNRFVLPAFASGGPVTSPTIGLIGEAGPEYVLSAPAVKALGGIAAADDLHKGLVTGSTNDEMGGPNDAVPGGVGWQNLWAIIQRQFPSARMTSNLRRGDHGYHGRGLAIDIAGPRPGDAGFMAQMNRWIAQAYPGSTELIYTPGINLKNGKPFTYSNAVRADHYDHVHWALGAGGTGIPVPEIVNIDPVATVKQFFGDVGNLLGKVGGVGPIFDMARGFGQKMFSSAWDAAVGKATTSMSTEGAVGVPPGPVQDMVRQVANRYGWGAGGQWDALARLIQKESSWNPTAQNPTSTAYGLFQFLNSTWAGVGGRKTSDPGLQAVYGLKYIQQRYGTPSGALAFHNRNNWYDSGGVLAPGTTVAHNGTGQNEYVFTKDQMNGMGGININGPVTVVANNPQEFFEQLQQVSRKGAKMKAGHR